MLTIAITVLAIFASLDYSGVQGNNDTVCPVPEKFSYNPNEKELKLIRKNKQYLYHLYTRQFADDILGLKISLYDATYKVTSNRGTFSLNKFIKHNSQFKIINYSYFLCRYLYQFAFYGYFGTFKR